MKKRLTSLACQQAPDAVEDIFLATGYGGCQSSLEKWNVYFEHILYLPVWHEELTDSSGLNLDLYSTGNLLAWSESPEEIKISIILWLPSVR